MHEALRRLVNNLLESGKDLLPIVIVIAFFQIAVLQRPIRALSNLNMVGAVKAIFRKSSAKVGLGGYANLELRN